ncbi:hypothetical protein NEUTE1DRAFT_121458 [Neurospora tetrasperma FGSC 2508]|uniref:Cytochrome b561 domain-containing protein n=1 Tax=Neurospora tetrasperma (strain FGSC 2508 / ATCC MYA-4615 / P0657) TaxID=510951 RepID=F8MHZ7_NEUT8|nr:uncharacterized protein NEUTE1DRAFT_121458 [Neurospora tetrasperma FGSC 2508]EGO59705.1 hypothetical protein NEUTE1DRAFT_121458 [Neurospora tetrasperma FGSC 2508]EGZ73842.1 hypothetical protein NEUTE2DRAFT_87463 [Neurospora tetrasperma FGSC 2509]
MFPIDGERPFVLMALLSAAKLVILIGVFCFVVAVEGRPDVHHHFGFPDPSQRAPSAPVAQEAPGNDRVSKYYLHVHGIIAALAFVILFPLGSILIRLLPGRLALFAHATWQLSTLIVYLAAVGLGIHLIKRDPNTMRNGRLNYHPIIGIFILALLFIQPLVGIFHHKEYKVNRRRGVWSALHLILGRIAITIGMINGYIGLIAMDDDTKTKVKAIYVAIALAIWLLWTAMSIWWEWKRHRRERAEKELERALAEDGTGVGADRGVNDQSDTRAREALRKAKRSRG